LTIVIIILIGVGLLLWSNNASGEDVVSQFFGNLSASQIAVVAANAGFSGDDLVTAVAVALAESSGNPKANGDLSITPGGSVGLWQVNLRWHPEFKDVDLTDPQTNANAAYSIYEAADYSFSPWSTFTTGAYQAKLQTAQQGVSA
jgi:hypothetical protein